MRSTDTLSATCDLAIPSTEEGDLICATSLVLEALIDARRSFPHPLSLEIAKLVSEQFDRRPT